jgi:outer membrane protein OmpA-like peptidoglycan-associated protein/opacity protein-like surface antigen
MKTKTALLSAAAALFLLNASGAAASDGWYLSIEGGANWVQDWKAKQLFTSGGSPATQDLGTMSFDNGWAILAAVGYGRGNWSAEFEAGYRKNDADTFTHTGFSPDTQSAELKEASFMANLLYSYPVASKLVLSVGAGAGADYAKLDLTSSGTPSEDSSWSLAYQGLARASYSVGPKSEIFLSYRYFRASNPDFDMRPELNSTLSGEDFVKHTATIGFRYHLGVPGIAAPAAPDTPAANVAPSEFIIFFGHNKSDLTKAALNVVREAASTAKDLGIANVRIVGHADRSGSSDYNQALSMRRANVVRGALVSEGVADASIAVDGKGEAEPLVPTADGVREPQNRRVNISF